MVETDVFTRLFGLLQDWDPDDPEIQQSSTEVIIALAKFGRLILSFCTVRGLMIQQMISAQRLWKKMFLLILLACFKIRPGPYGHHLWTSSLPWRNSVGRYVNLRRARSHDPTDDFRSKILEKDILVHLFRLLEDWVLRTKFKKAITTLAEFGGFLYIIFCTGRGLMIRQTISAPR